MTKATVLIVEDEGVIAMDVAHHLESFGYAVAGVAHTGARAIEKARAHRPDIILMDVALKGPMDGVEAAATIRAERDVPVVFLSAYSDENTVERAGRTSPAGYLLKPFRPDELRAAIEVALVRHGMERELRRARHWFEMTLRCIGDAVLATDADGRVQFVNPVAERLLGYSQADAAGEPVARIFEACDETTGEPISNPAQRALERRVPVTLTAGTAVRTRSGQSVPVDDAAAPIVDSDGTLMGAVLVFRDISERRQTEAQLAHQALHDPLTGLANRAHLEQWLNRAVAAAERRRQSIATVFLDLDGFKRVNDTMGHEAGDELLRAVGDRLRSQTRSSDFVSRLGGDEFVIVLADFGTTSDIGRVVDKCIRAVAEPVSVFGQIVSVTASAGVSLFPGDAETAQGLLRCADDAMYRAKELGKNTVQFYTRDMTTRAAERLAVEKDLRHALARDELELVYRPVGGPGAQGYAEAQWRWNHPAHSGLPFADLLSIAEATGLILPIGGWIADRACRDAAQWRAAARGPSSLWLSLSVRELRAPGLAETFRRALAAHGLGPGAIALDVPQAALMQDLERAQKVLAELREIGIAVWIDEFGVGPCDFAALCRLPIAGLVVGDTFVAGLPGSVSDAAAVNAIVALARGSGLSVAAKGIDTAAQGDFLLAAGCTVLRGSLFGDAMPAGQSRRQCP